MLETTIVLSDIHANAQTLRSAIELGKKMHVTRWVLLGDLLTYGVDVEEVVATVEGLSDEVNLLLLRGNHDQMYVDITAGSESYYRTLPDWIRESVDYTVERLDVERFSRLPWLDEAVVGEVLFSHANPFGDWRYLNDEESLAAALTEVVDRGSRVGVFGHVHRHRAWVVTGDAGILHSTARVTVGPDQSAAITTGSVGQPRDAGAPPSVLLLSFDGETFTAQNESVNFDVTHYLAAIHTSQLSEPTRVRLASFFAAS